MVVQRHVSHQRLLQIFTAGEAVRFKYIGYAPIKTLNHPVGLGRSGLGQSVFYAQGATKLVKLMVSRGLTLSTGKQPVGELFTVVGQDFVHPDWASLVQGFQKRACSRARLAALDLNKHPTRCTVYGDKQIPPAALIGHLRQVFDIHMNIKPGS